MDPPNVLLVILDSARARNCSLHGHDNETTPFLSEFADDAVTFEQARAPSVHSISSHASIFTGYHTEEHDVTEHKSFVRPETTVWHRIAAEHGYETGLFTPNVIVAQTSNLADVFDTCVGPKRAKFRLFDDALAPLDVQGRLSPKEYAREALGHDKPIRSLLNGVYKKLESRGGSHDPTSEGGDVYVDEFLSWVDERSGPWAACLNLMDSHTPFEPDPEYDNWSDDAAERARERVHDDEVPEPFTDAFWDHLAALEPLYDGTIRQADAAVERLVEAMDERGLLDETTVVVTSDHGEGFGERTELDTDVRLRHHSWGIDEVLTHVPLLVRSPGGDGGRTVEAPASLTRFPDVVDATIEGDDPADAFVPEGDVLSSTFRIKPPGNELSLPEPEREPYFGPWRAVYRETEDGVVKYARRGDDAIELGVPDAQRTVRRADSDGGVVAEAFDALEPQGVRLGSAAGRDVEDDVEDRLADLGYLR
ncbi:sulfatase-like hydrolase/transferase [Halosimplex sp. TS25]|uniref:sulfatase-like hydrolase/transferase n=1 Tax=Halosimplex rarum TaxID=3396619 RepID=UPI0039EB37F5